jgi:hypothetical protein
MLDGLLVGEVKHGRTQSIDVEVGHHELYLAIDWTRSPTVQLNLGRGGAVRVRCWPKGNPWSLPYYATIGRTHAIGVEVVDDGGAAATRK